MAGCLAGRLFLELAGGRGDVAAGRILRVRGWRNGIIAVSLALVFLRIWWPDYTGPSQWLWLLDVAVKYPIFILPFASIIVAVASGSNFLSPLLERRWMVVLGEASYALYMIHWSVTTFLRLGYLGRWSTPGVHAFLMLVTLAASYLCYRYVEIPWRERLRGPSERGSLSAAVASPQG